MRSEDMAKKFLKLATKAKDNPDLMIFTRKNGKLDGFIPSSKNQFEIFLKNNSVNLAKEFISLYEGLSRTYRELKTCEKLSIVPGYYMIKDLKRLLDKEIELK